MLLRRLFLRHFRIYDECVFEFQPGVNLIVGPNACGKTTVLEAVHLFTAARSFRTAQLGELVKHGKEHFLVELTFEKHGVEQTLKITSDGKQRRLFHNHTELPSAAHLLGILPSTIFAPDHAALVKGAPQVRRQYLDLQLVQVDPLYVHYLARYQRAMRQRNTLLKNKQLATIALWEKEMARAAGYLTWRRREAVSELSALAEKNYHALADAGERLTLAYRTSASERADPQAIEEYYLAKFDKLRPRECDLGITLSGPHKDDLLVLLKGTEARIFASEGQQRGCVAAMKLAEWQRMKDSASSPPVMLIDDLGIGLDGRRKERFFDNLGSFQQVLVTATEAPERQKLPALVMSLA